MILTDVHQHLLWGLDDGAQDAATMHALLRAAHNQQVGRVFATPHACPGFKPFDMALYEDRLAQARAFCRENQLSVEVCSGAEVAWTYHTVRALERRQVPTLGETDCVLLELWPDIAWGEAEEAVEQVVNAGFMPLLAHVERYRCFVHHPSRALKLKERFDVAYQVNAATVLGGGGFFTKRFLKKMFRERALDAVASDAHNCKSRPQLMQKAYQVLCVQCGEQYAGELVNFSEVLP